MPLLLDVLEVLARLALRRIVLAHVAEPAGELGEPLAVGAVADPVHRQMLRAGEARAREQRQNGLGVEASRMGDAAAECRRGTTARGREARKSTRSSRGGQAVGHDGVRRAGRGESARTSRSRSTRSSAARARGGQRRQRRIVLHRRRSRARPRSATFTPGLRIPSGSNASFTATELRERLRRPHVVAAAACEAVRRRARRRACRRADAASATTSSRIASTRARQSGLTNVDQRLTWMCAVAGVAEDHAARVVTRENLAHAAHVLGQILRRHRAVLDELHRLEIRRSSCERIGLAA